MKKSPLRRLEVVVIVLLLLCQGTQAMHFHVRAADFDGSTSMQALTAADSACPVCWAQQAVGAAVPLATVSAMFVPTPPAETPAIVAPRLCLRSCFSPRAPPEVLS